MLGPTVSIFVDYESPLARAVAGKVWGGISAAALDAGYTRATALWESLRAPASQERPQEPQVRVFVLGQDRPEAVDAVRAAEHPEAPRFYGVVVAVPERPSPLSGALLYQGVERITGAGVKAAAVEPALLHALPGECESYARQLLKRLSTLPEA